MLPPRSMLKTRVRPGLAMSRSRAIEEEDERYNPIRPSNGNIVMRGGAYDVMKSSRTPRLSMADSRAMEIQRRNETPGTGATPVMGISEVRGGAMERYVGGGHMMDDALWDLLSSLPATKLKKAISMLNRLDRSNDPDDYYTISFAKGASKEDMLSACEGAAPTKDSVKAVIEAFPIKAKKAKKGGSAVPSMGLSEFRGGKLYDMTGGANPLLDYTNVARSGAYEGQGRSRKSMPPVAMRGGKHHRNGHALSEHLLAELGAPSHKKLLEGMMRHATGVHGGAWWDFLDPKKNGVANAFQDFGAKVKNEFVNPQSFLRTKVQNEFTNPESVLRGKVLPVAARVGQFIAPALNAAVPGAGTAISTGLSAAQGANQQAKAFGFGRHGKKKRAPASAGDGRRKRADIVRKVMADRGVKMIEASKIVKAEGLY